MKTTPALTPAHNKINEVIINFDRDDFGAFLEADPELQMAYDACMQTANRTWSDELIAADAFRRLYGENIDGLMMAWRFRQELMAGDRNAIAVHIAVIKWKRRQIAMPQHANKEAS
ncbi:MAG: hypothetical protein H0X37_26705 [Herpetosiphonaceae bacterium]|nr:hypothetical protein [Herpetosiphonaceae bacterium]